MDKENQLNREELWKLRLHFGHLIKIWNPKMKPYIYGTKNKLHIINLKKVIECIENLIPVFKELGEKKTKIIFVGTKSQAKFAVKDIAERTNNYYVSERWLGGTLTNFNTIKLRINRLWEIKKNLTLGKINWLPKKEKMAVMKEKNRLERYFSGIETMRELPQAMFVINPNYEINAVKEARKINIPVFGLCDTNTNPDLVDYVIPGNDDYEPAISFVLEVLMTAYAEGMGIILDEPKERPEVPKMHYHSFYNYENGSLVRRYEPIVPLNVNKAQYLSKQKMLKEAERLVNPQKKPEDVKVVIRPEQRYFKYFENPNIVSEEVAFNKPSLRLDAKPTEHQEALSVQEQEAHPEQESQPIEPVQTEQEEPKIEVQPKKETPAKVEHHEKPQVAKEPKPQPKAVNHKTFDIQVIDNDLTKSLSKLKITQLKALLAEIKVQPPRVKMLKGDLITLLSQHLIIKNEVITLKKKN